jgi:protein O-GlcNAc transferase
MASIPELLSLAIENHESGRRESARQIYEQILQSEPNHVDAAHLLGVVAHQSGEHSVAVDYIERAIALNDRVAAFHNNLGGAYFALRRIPEAIKSYRRALELAPDYVEALSNLGNVLRDDGKLEEAVAYHRRALELKPDYVEGHNNLGVALAQLGKPEEAVACYRKAIELNPDYAEAHNNYANSQKDQGKLEEAIVGLRRAVELQANYASAHNNLGAALNDQGKWEEAVKCYRRALELNPDYPEAHNNLGVTLMERGNLKEAIPCYRQALELRPEYAEANNNLGNVLKDHGMLDEAIGLYRRALEIKPRYVKAHTNLLLTLHYRPGTTPALLAEAHADFERQHAAPLRHLIPWHGNASVEKTRLRLGFVSPDLGRHPVGYFLVRILENLTFEDVDTICYSDRRHEDDLTDRCRIASSDWRSSIGMSDDQLAGQIRHDRIDILFDLAGHTARNRVLVFARKPAPIQVTWAGYVGTTGLKTMDYVLADGYQVPISAECHYQERILRMPDGYVCYDPPAYAPPLAPLPAFARGHVTFGCFSNPAKITPHAVEIWSRILQRLPEARLVFRYKGWNDDGVIDRFGKLFSAQGIELRRVEFLGSLSHVDLLAEYNRVDLALDPFPYSGGVTTCEALWMGVSVVTCPGETFASRHALSHLSNAGVPESVARNLDEYVELAVSLAKDLPRLSLIRSGLRERMASSPLCDGRRFARNLVALLRYVWKEMTGSKRDALTLESAIQHREAGRLLAAREICERILQSMPDHVDAIHLLGLIAHQTGDDTAAIDYMVRAIALNNGVPAFHNNLGGMYFALRRIPESIACYRRALELAPDYAEAHSNLGNVLKDEGDLEKAIACHRRALELKPDHVEAHNNLGVALAEQGKFDEATGCYRRALELRPDHSEAFNNLGVALKEQGKVKEAADCFHQALRLKPAYREAGRNLEKLKKGAASAEGGSQLVPPDKALVS